MVDKPMKNFKCDCGKILSPPKLETPMFVGEVEGDYTVQIRFKCKCGRLHRSFYKGKIEDIGLEK
jgi:hypothetical protein